MRIAAADLPGEIDGVDEELLAAPPFEQPLETHPGEDRALRPKPLADRLDHRPRAEREAAQIVIVEAEMSDQLGNVARQNPLRIVLRLVRLRAVTMDAMIGHDHPKTRGGDLRRGAELDPVDLGARKQPVEQDDRPPIPRFMPGKHDSVRCRPAVGRGLSHARNAANAANLRVRALEASGPTSRYECSQSSR